MFAADTPDGGLVEDGTSTAITSFGIDVPMLVQAKVSPQATPKVLTAGTMTSEQTVGIPICVYSNDGEARNYKIKVTGANADGTAFKALLDGSETIKLAYTLDYTDQAAMGSGTEYSKAGAALVFCNVSGTYNKELTARFSAVNMQAAPEGMYNDTLTIDVSPETGTD
ncbi:MAG: hypothetical protein U1E45_14800 [Geminicoccaceae bacterium]